MQTKDFKKHFSEKKKNFTKDDKYLMALNGEFYLYQQEIIKNGLAQTIQDIYNSRYDYIKFLLDVYGFKEKDIAQDLNISPVMVRIYLKGKLKSREVNNWLLRHINFCFD